MGRRIKWGWISLALYLLSLWLPCLTLHKLLQNGTEPQIGFICLYLGYVVLPWYANPLLLFAAIANAFRAYEAGIVFCVLALAVAATTPWFLDRAESVEVGYVVWLASMVAMLVNLITRRAHRRQFEDVPAA